MTIMMKKAAAAVEMKECFNCADVHDVEEMSHCLIATAMPAYIALATVFRFPNER